MVDICGEKPGLLTNQSNKYGIYVALSYSGGDNGSNMLQLQKETQAALKSEISFAKLRRSHQHGIQVARELGYDYIWIEALCIVQNVKHNWAMQSSLITEIYGNTDLTIVAGRSSHSGNGFLEFTSAISVLPV